MSNIRAKVSICIAQYNRADALKGMIDSILAQTHGNFEAVIVNDGSTDPRTKEILDGYTDPRLKIIHKGNTGFVDSLRLAIASSSGEFIAIHGAGDCSRPERINRQAEILEKEPNVGIVGCLVETIVEGGPQHGKAWYDKPSSLQPGLDVLLHDKNPFTHGEVMFRRSHYDTVGGYRAFFRFSQDRDLWIRMAEHCDMRIVDEVLYTRYQFFSDGVSMDRNKVLLQQQLAEFSTQCHFDRRDFGKDFVDMYGQHAGLFKSRSSKFGNYCVKRTIVFCLEDDAKTTEFYMQLAVRSGGFFVRQLLPPMVRLLQKSPPLRSILKKYVQSRFNYNSLISGK